MVKSISTSTSGRSNFSDLRQKLFFVFLVILIYRFGSHVPVPGLDPDSLANFFNQQKGSILSLLNMFSGGALSRFSLFALGIMPYISASIIIQLFTAVIPQLEQMKKEGEIGRKKINKITRYSALLLASIQSFGMAKFIVNSGMVLDPSWNFYFVTCVTLSTGTMFLMWLGEQVTEKGVGNGISIIICAGIIAGLPGALGQTLEQTRQGQLPLLVLFSIIIIVLSVTAFVVFMERGQRRIKINYPQRYQNKGSYTSQTSHLPLKINMAGVIPPIFASSIILFPVTLTQLFGQGESMQWLSQIGLALSQGQPLYILFFSSAIIFFCFFYTAIVFNPKDTADNLKKSGAFISGIRPGEQTAQYIDNVMSRLTLVGAIYITLVCLLPEFMNLAWQVPFYFGGTSLLIIVVVIMDFMTQLQTLVMSQQYESLIKKANLKGIRG